MSQSLLSWMSPWALVVTSPNVTLFYFTSQSLLSWMSPWAGRTQEEILSLVESQSLLSWMSPWAFSGMLASVAARTSLNPCCRG